MIIFPIYFKNLGNESKNLLRNLDFTRFVCTFAFKFHIYDDTQNT